MGRSSNATLAAPQRPRQGRRSRISAAEDVVAVVVQRGDRTCSVICRGAGFSWPTVGDAKAAVERMAPRISWRETTRGVWVARTS